MAFNTTELGQLFVVGYLSFMAGVGTKFLCRWTRMRWERRGT